MHAPGYWRGLAALATAIAVVAARAPAQDDKAPNPADRVEKGEGVILRVEPIAEEGDAKKEKGKEKDAKPRRVKITVNTAAVWRDFARDQAGFATKPDPKAGENSIATKGQPESESTLIVAEVARDTVLSQRYRSATDEATDGERTIPKTERKDGSPESGEVKLSPKDKKAPKVSMEDLKPGLFVEIDARKGKAHKIVVLEPLGGPQTPPSEARPESK